MEPFSAAGNWRPWLCCVLCAGVVGLPFHAGQCGLEGAGDIGRTKLPILRHGGCISNEPPTCKHGNSNLASSYIFIRLVLFGKSDTSNATVSFPGHVKFTGPGVVRNNTVVTYVVERNILSLSNAYTQPN